MKRDFGVDMTVYRLRKLYMKNGVKCRNTQMVYRNHYLRRHELEVDRWKFVKRLLQVEMSGEPYGYIGCLFELQGRHQRDHRLPAEQGGGPLLEKRRSVPGSWVLC